MAGEDGDRFYWDPMPHIDMVLGVSPGCVARSPQDLDFCGKWEERNWRNVPGPIYGAMTDNCWVGRLHAPQHVLYGDDIDYEQEFLYRQPRTVDELRDVVVAMAGDPWGGWACDGDAHWTPDLVREWWSMRPRLKEWITSKHLEWSESSYAQAREAATGLLDYLAYLDSSLADHLRAYMFFLDHRRSPTTADRLPAW